LLASATNNITLQNALDEATAPTQAEEDAIGRKPGMLGMVLAIVKQDIIVSAVSDNSPASRAEIEPGSVVVAVDGKAVAGKTLAEATLAIRGDVGTRVTLDLLEGKPPVKRTLVLTREKAPFVVVSDPL
jgi:carboxyl-terminal processing protease